MFFQRERTSENGQPTAAAFQFPLWSILELLGSSSKSIVVHQSSVLHLLQCAPIFSAAPSTECTNFSVVPSTVCTNLRCCTFYSVLQSSVLRLLQCAPIFSAAHSIVCSNIQCCAFYSVHQCSVLRLLAVCINLQGCAM